LLPIAGLLAACGARDPQGRPVEVLRRDITPKRKLLEKQRKLLEKQKEGKKRMKNIRRVDVPQEAFVAALSTDAAGDKGKK
jgi:GTP-binding protein LepA